MATGALEGFFSLLDQAKAPTFHRRDWIARLGEPATKALVRTGVLVARAQAHWYPCGGPWGDGCPRRVVENHGSREHPFVAVCGRDDGSCLEVLLRADEREVLAASVDGLTRQLRRVLHAGGAADAEDAGFPGARRIGERDGRAVYLALAPHWPEFEAWLAARGEAIVLVPSVATLPPAVRERFRDGAVVVVSLGEALCPGDDGLVGALPERLLVVRDSARATYGASPPTVCTVIDNGGERTVTRPEYEALVAGAPKLDLFIDTTVTAAGGGHPASSRDEKGKLRRDTLTVHEAAALVELVRTRRALREGDFATVSVNAVAKVVERGRRKVDVQLGRYEWRAFHTLRADTPEGKRWQFNPPQGFTAAVVFAPPRPTS